MVNLRHSLLFEMGYLNKRTKYVKQWVSDIGYQCRTMIPETGGETNESLHYFIQQNEIQMNQKIQSKNEVMKHGQNLLKY